MFKLGNLLGKKTPPKTNRSRLDDEKLIASMAKKLSAYQMRKAVNDHHGIEEVGVDFNDRVALDTSAIQVETIDPKDAMADPATAIPFNNGTDYINAALRHKKVEPLGTRDEAIWNRENK